MTYNWNSFKTQRFVMNKKRGFEYDLGFIGMGKNGYYLKVGNNVGIMYMCLL